MSENQKKRKRNPWTAIVILTALMLLPFMAFLLDKFLLKFDNSLLFLAEISIVTLGLASASIIYFFFFKS
jgi:flagellar basal body-associated protein FliL